MKSSNHFTKSICINESMKINKKNSEAQFIAYKLDLGVAILFNKSVSMDILLAGETGTGKTYLAKQLHKSSNRTGPFIYRNIGAVNKELIESTLFGHKQGSFTGADKDKSGAFELSKNGTLLLDEITEINPEIQIKLLSVIEEKEFWPIGAQRSVKTNAKIIFASNRNLEDMVDQKLLREDLYFRISKGCVYIPPLRKRKDEIPQLINYFIVKHAERENKKIKLISQEAIKYLLNYSWPGNIRELEGVVQAAMITCSDDNDTLSLQDIKMHMNKAEKMHKENTEVCMTSFLVKKSVNDIVKLTKLTKIAHAKKRCGNNKALIAQYLNISRKQLRRWEREIEVSVEV